MVTSDALIALSDATAGSPGLVAIAGAGGWGCLFGDEGGPSTSCAKRCARHCATGKTGDH
jgi:N-acetylglucosamine kinase-like BadF-type ATPase